MELQKYCDSHLTSRGCAGCEYARKECRKMPYESNAQFLERMTKLIEVRNEK